MARTQKPKGKEIAQKAREMKLDKNKSAHGEKHGKSIKFTGTKLPLLNSLEELEEGQVVGVLETELGGDETPLPPGKFNLFLAKVNGDWHVYAESDGEIRGEAKRVTVERYLWGERKEERPRFSPEGFCFFSICLLGWGPFCIVGIGLICF